MLPQACLSEASPKSNSLNVDTAPVPWLGFRTIPRPGSLRQVLSTKDRGYSPFQLLCLEAPGALLLGCALVVEILPGHSYNYTCLADEL